MKDYGPALISLDDQQGQAARDTALAKRQVHNDLQDWNAWHPANAFVAIF